MTSAAEPLSIPRLPVAATRADRTSGSQCLASLRKSAPQVLPSMLLCDFGNLQREVARLEEAGVSALHLDVMDGRFVPNLTYGMPIVRAFRGLTRLPLDVHLMIADPRKYVGEFIEAGADVVTIHVEAAEDPAAALAEIRQLGAGAGLALNPGTPLSAVEPHLPLCDLVLAMSVPAGFGGQAFQPVALEKLRRLKDLARPETVLEVDGGVNEKTIAACAAAGAQLFVVGSAIFSSGDYKAAVRRLTEQAAQAV